MNQNLCLFLSEKNNIQLKICQLQHQHEYAIIFQRVIGKTIFYKNRSCFIPKINIFSNTIFEELKNYLGIEFEINKRIKFSQTYNDDCTSGYYSDKKTERIQLLYDFNVDFILRMTQLLYYEDLNNGKLYAFCAAVSDSVQQIFVPNAGNPKYDVRDPEQFQDIIYAIFDQLVDDKQTNDKKTFLVYFQAAINKTGRRLQDCYKLALEKCQPFKIMIEQQIDLEFPIQTFQDKVAQKEKIVVSNKKTK